MKRLLLTLSAVACAFGLNAAETWAVGTSFEGETGSLTNNTAVGDLLGSNGSYWSVPSDDANQELTVKSYIAAGINTPYVDDLVRGTRQATAWGNSASDENFLSIKTSFGKPLVCKVKGNEGQFIEDGIYIDSQVKFTACDEKPTNLTDEKLVVYVYEDDTTGETNLYVNAGSIASDGTVTRKDYKCMAWNKGNAWVRLTVKTIANILSEDGKHCPGFVVFINSTNEGSDPIGCTGEKCALPMTDNANAFGDNLFPAYVGDVTSLNNKLVSIGFDGQGALNDLVVNDEPPFESAKDKKFFTVNRGENVTSFDYAVNGGTAQTATSAAKVTFEVNQTITISNVQVAEGYMYTGVTQGSGCSVSDNVITMTAEGGEATVNASMIGVTIGDQKFVDLASAITYVNGTTASGVIVMNFAADFTPEPFSTSIEPGDNVTSLTIDLAGKTLTYTGAGGYAIDCAVALTINDSSNTNAGKIECSNPDNEDGVVQWGTTLTVTGGTFDGYVAQGGSANEADITGGKFKDDNDPFYLWEENQKTISGVNYVATYADGYWTVAEAPKTGWAILLAGSGTSEDPYQIADEEDLLFFATNVNNAAGSDFTTVGVYFEQTADITLTGTFPGVAAGSAKDWVNKATAGYGDLFRNGSFRGNFDGGNYTISGFVLARGDYMGLFNSAYGATIKNVKVSLGSATGIAAGASDAAAGIIAGVTVDTTLENCVTVANAEQTFTGNKAISGLVGYASDGTVLKNCTNTLAVCSSGNQKVAGLVGCAQQIVNTDITSEAKGEVIENCANFGNVTGPNDKEGISGLVSYTDNAVTFKGANTFSGTLTGNAVQSVINLNGGTVALAEGATITVPAAYKTVNQKAVSGIRYATVDGNVATLVADDALGAGGSYKVMATGGSPVVTLAAGESITFDTTLAALTSVAGITTSAAGYEVTNASGVYTATPKTLNITYAYTTNGVPVTAAELGEALENGAQTTFTVVDPVAITTNAITLTGYTQTSVEPASWAAGAKTADVTVTVAFEKAVSPVVPGEPIVIPPGTDPSKAVEDANKNKADLLEPPAGSISDSDAKTAYQSLFTAATDGKTVEFVLNEFGTNAVVTATEDAATNTLTQVLSTSAASTDVTISKPIPGFYYSLKQGGDLSNLGYAADADKNKVGGKDNIQFNLSKPTNAGFYQVIVSPTPEK